ncbi:two-component system, LytTR family, sensor histidine kinase AgrC [Enterococcus sp. AZ194]|uniref:sensor histidine kinase n=1 Tax=Enterococcus sp. AZ194 TaxID=2774629 RepID=UPI003F220380
MNEFLDSMQLFYVNYYMLIDFISGWIANIILVYTLQLLIRHKRPVWVSLLTALLFELVSYVGSLILGMSGMTGIVPILFNNFLFVLDLLILVVAFKLYQKKNYILVFLAFMISYIIWIGGAYLTLGLFYSLIDLSKYVFLGTFFSMIATPFVSGVAYLILKRLDITSRIVRIANYKASSYIVMFVIIVNASILAFIVSLFMEAMQEVATLQSFEPLQNYTNEMVLILLADISFSVVLIWFSSYLFMNMEKVERQKNELIQQQLYIQKLENLQSEMKTMRHDYKNIISSIYLQAKEGDISAIQDYLSKTMNHLDEQIGSSIMLSSQLVNLKVMELKSLLLVKLMELENENIRYTIEVPYPINSIKMSMSDFTRCLGILIDNAKEEVMKQNHGSLSIVLLNEAAELNVMVKNSIVEKPLLQKIWEEGYSTKGMSRGLGLSSYLNIISRYEFVLKQTKISAEEQEFIQSFSVMK